MGVSVAVVLFLVLALGWALLAFLPSIREIRRKVDVAPLPVSGDSQVDIRHFAQGFRDHVDQHYEPLITQCRASGEALSGELETGGAYVIVPDGATEPPLAEEEREFCDRVILSAGDLTLPGDFVYAAEVYAPGDVTGGECNVYRAVLASGSMHLATGSASLRWLHAGAGLSADAECLLHGRVSADGPLRLDAGCRFERLHAPLIDFGAVADATAANGTRPIPPAPDAEATTVDPERIPHLADTRGGRWLVDRKFELASDQILASDMVVRGTVVLRSGALVCGSLKSRGVMILEAGVRVDGSLVCEKDLVLGAGCRVNGPLICEETLTLGRGCVVGDADRPTTVSARRILVEPGARCHGTVWAHEQGDVLAPPAPNAKAPANPVTVGGETA